MANNTHILECSSPELLPFARSRLKAMRATGLQYLSQKFDVDGHRVDVRIAGDQEFISVSGGTTTVLSGVVKNGLKIKIPPPSGSPIDTAPTYTLRSYKPTEQSIKDAKSKVKPPIFADEPKLVVDLAKRLSGLEENTPALDYYQDVSEHFLDGLQYTHVTGSMYSGKMAKLVQILLGYGRTNTKTQPQKDPNEPDPEAAKYEVALGYTKRPEQDPKPGLVAQVLYDYRWLRCHGIVTASDGKLWLVEISKKNGVIAMPLPMLVISKFKDNKKDVLREAGQLFGGLPSGGTFPADVLIEDAINEGSVIRLATVEAMRIIFDKETFSSAMGWSFTQDGKQAHNTCWYSATPFVFGGWHMDVVTSYHYRMDINIDSRSAVVTLVSSGELSTNGAPASIDGVWDAVPFGFSEPASLGGPPQIRPLPAQTLAFNASPTTMDAPLFVCHLNDVLEVVRVKYQAQSTELATVKGYIHGAPTGYSSKYYWGGRYITTNSFPVIKTTGEFDEDFAFTVRSSWSGTGMVSGVLRNVVNINTWRSISGYNVERLSPPGALWAHGTRDGYLYFEPKESRYSTYSPGFTGWGGQWVSDYMYIRFNAGLYETYIVAGSQDTTLAGDYSLCPGPPSGAGFSDPTFSVVLAYYNSLAETITIPPDTDPGTGWDLHETKPAKLFTLLPSGEIIAKEMTYPDNVTYEATLRRWRDPGGWMTSPLEKRPFLLRSSAVGPHFQVARSPDIDLSGTVTDGTMIPTGAATPDNYSFVGYI